MFNGRCVKAIINNLFLPKVPLTKCYNNPHNKYKPNCNIDIKLLCIMSSDQSNSNLTALNKLGVLSKDHVKIKNPERVNQILSSMMNSGFDKLQIIADYDMTITRFWTNGERSPSSFGILDNSPLMPSFYREESNKLLQKYYPIEIDPKLTEEEKIPLMEEWYSNVHRLLVKCQFSKESIKEMVAMSNVRLRDGTEQFFSSLHNKNVPVLVFSAGMGDVLEESLHHFSVYFDNVKVVSNFFQYNEQNVMVGFKGDLIHMFNKNENAIHSSNYFNDIKTRDNIILMGDSLGDIKMSSGVPQPNNTLNIGFLNDKIEERLESYLNAYDIVLTDDQTMDIPRSVIQLIDTGLSS